MNNNLNIRNAAMEDLKEIAAIERECFPSAEAASEESLRERLEYYANHFWLLCEGERVLGFINGMVTDESDLSDEMYENAGMHREDGEWQMIFGVDTRPGYRRMGYAEKIMRRVISDAREQGRKGLVLTCKEELIHYYAKFGFVNEGISESVHGNAVWYQMRLSF